MYCYVLLLILQQNVLGTPLQPVSDNDACVEAHYAPVSDGTSAMVYALQPDISNSPNSTSSNPQRIMSTHKPFEQM